ncbi:MAG: 50S ribosomal protein L18 [Candidatus Pacearchaeota archaeon]
MKTQKKRRREGKTNYKKRIALLKSGLPRIVFRKTNRYILSQYITSKEAQDKVIENITSKKLLDYGWPENKEGSLNSIPASYLTGFLFGKIIQKKKLKTPILDPGMVRIIYGNKFFSFIKGLKESGVEVKCDEKSFPSEERVRGKHLKEDFSETFEKIKSKIEKELK